MQRSYVIELWTFKDPEALGVDMAENVDLTGFEVEATDGKIGKIDEATYEVGGSYVVVDTGPWIFGKKVMLPAGMIQRVDLDTQAVFVDRTKDAIKSAPEFDESAYRDESYRSTLDSYYGDERR
jgi:hypothetical protein